jgi:hypothetical protein
VLVARWGLGVERVPKALASVAPELLAREPDIRMADLVAVK